ncbi:hypothetical protein acdb102_10210 [Acidothermaceae bacterium B102]|nr:hypothetical protein acdb102_10210 [Acidothermaceae bacterium B102]
MATADPADLASLLREQRQAIHARQAFAMGISKGRLRHQIDAGRWQRPYPSVLVSHNGPLNRETREWCAVLWASDGLRHVAGLYGPSSAAIQGLKGHVDDVVHVVIDTRRQLSAQPDVRVHHCRDLGEHQLHPVRQPPCTRLPRAVVETALGRRSADDAVAVLASAVQQRLVRASDLAVALVDFPRARHRALCLEVLSDIEGGAHSLPEVDFARLLRRNGLPQPDRQVVRYEGGRKRYLDNIWIDARLTLEIDGGLHLEPESYWDDMWRDAEIGVDGVLVLRLPASAIRRHEARVVDLLRRALARFDALSA